MYRDVNSRREFVKQALYGAAGVSLLGLPEAVADDPYGPFKVGLQSYSLRKFDQAQMLEASQKMGLTYLEGYNSHFPQTADQATIQKYLDTLKAANTKLIAFGVVSFGPDEAQARRVFEYAKAMGIEVLTANPQPQALGYLEKLVEEFQISIAIHNHGPGALYDKIDQVVKAMEGRHERIGACIDTGHFMRSKEDPLQAIKACGKRIYGVHFKDLDETNKFAELGKGKLDLMGCLQALADQKMQGCFAIEYEEHPDDPVPYIEQYLAVLRESVKKLRV